MNLNKHSLEEVNDQPAATNISVLQFTFVGVGLGYTDVARLLKGLQLLAYYLC